MTTIPPEPPGPPSDGDDNRPQAPASPPGGSSAPPPPPPADGGYAPPAAPAGGYVEPQPGYGAPAPGGYGAPAPGGYAGPPMAYAEWPQRVLSALIDTVGPFIVAGLLYAANRPLGAVVWLAAIVWAIYNAYLGGQTGQSYGKKTVGTRLVLEATGQPVGGGVGVGRYFLHIVDSIPCYVGYLWPLWDSKKQTFADKLLKTVVVTA
jgi:uncharacterized RDD family membrane protein YckC